jgi:hypothetical protein
MGFPSCSSQDRSLIFQRNDLVHIQSRHAGLDMYQLSGHTAQSPAVIGLRLSHALATHPSQPSESPNAMVDEWQYHADNFASKRPAKAPQSDQVWTCLVTKKTKNRDSMPKLIMPWNRAAECQIVKPQRLSSVGPRIYGPRALMVSGTAKVSPYQPSLKAKSAREEEEEEEEEGESTSPKKHKKQCTATWTSSHLANSSMLVNSPP